MKIIILLLISIFSFNLIAGSEQYSERIEGNAIVSSAVIETFDARYMEMNLSSTWSSLYKNETIKNYVQLGYIQNNFPVTNQSTEVSLLVESWEYDVTGFVVNSNVVKLIINYDVNGQFIIDEKSTYSFENANRTRVSIISVNGPVEHVYIESNIEIERIYNMMTAPIIDYGHNLENYSAGTFGLEPTLNSTNNTLEPTIEFWWKEVLGAESYELEWTFISDYNFDILNGVETEVLSSDLDFDFYTNSTRIEITDNHYKIPGVFNKGYVIYRVRAIGVQFDNPEYKLEGGWTFAESGSVDDFIANSSMGAIKIGIDFEQDMNWAYSVSYSDDGKRFEGISYFDAMGRTRQSLGHNTEEGQMIINNVYFDKVGRPVIGDLPTPDEIESFSFRKDFNYIVNSTGTVPFYLSNYLEEAADCELPNPMSTQYGTGKYYSNQNTNTDRFNSFIPDAGGYPFSKIVYMNDPTGRIKEVGGYGLDLQVTQHSTKMSYATPTQNELNALFGTEVGLAEHYQKTTRTDANGQVYVQYTDLAGRVVATALSGPSPSNLETLSNNSGPAQVTEEIYTDELDNNNDLLIASYSFSPSIEFDQNYTLEHSFTPAVFQDDNNCLSGICLDCHYNYSIKIIKTDCWPHEIKYQHEEEINGTTINNICNNSGPVISNTGTIALVAGTYSVSFELSVNDELAELYWCEYVANADESCVPGFKSIYENHYISADFGCDPVVISSSTLSYCDLKRDKMLKDVSIGGQYGQVYDTYGNILPTSAVSVFNENNILTEDINDPKTWKNPSVHYVDEMGIDSWITAYETSSGSGEYTTTPNGTSPVLVYPEQLIFEDFVDEWIPSWAEALIAYHPEYCYLAFCEENSTDFHSFSSTFTNTNTFDDACSNGLFSPLGSTTLPVALNSCNTTPAQIDDFFVTGYYSGDIALWAADNYSCIPVVSYTNVGSANSSLQNFHEVIENGTSMGYLSIWEYAIWQAVCPGENTWTGINNCVANATLDDCSKELVWTIFKNEYSNIRDRAYLFAQAAYVTYPPNLIGGGCGPSNNSCFGISSWNQFSTIDCFDHIIHYDVNNVGNNPTPPANGITDIVENVNATGPCGEDDFFNYSSVQPNFINFYSSTVVNNTGYDLTTISGTNAFMNAQYAEIYDESCEAQADEWMDILEDCAPNSSTWLPGNTVYDEIRNGFIEVCVAGCSPSNVGGLSSLPVGTTTASGYTSFEDVLDTWLPTGYSDLECTHYLISSPPPHDANPLVIENEIIDDCACDALLQAKADFAINTDPSITNISEMLAHNTGINLDLAAQLACVCEKVYDDNHSTAWTPGSWNSAAQTQLSNSNVQVPIELTCGYSAPCSDCAEINSWYTQFITLFGTSVENHPNYEVLLQNYMNFNLGYSLTSEAYEMFMEGCNSTTSDPFCTINQLAGVWVDMIDVVARRGQLLNSNYDLVGNIVYDNSAIGSIIGGSYYSGVQSGNSMTITSGTSDVILTIPSGSDFKFEDIISFYNLIGTPCGTNDEFTVKVRILSCGLIESREITGYTADLDFVNCYCGGATLDLCNNSSSNSISDECYREELDYINSVSLDDYQQLLNDLRDEFISDYLEDCASAFETETMNQVKDENLYQFTLFYYDQAGNLIKTVAPEGVDVGFKNTANFATVNSDRNSSTQNVPNHTFITEYEYNSYNQLVATTNPDQEGYTNFWYDRYGRIVASQNPEQAPCYISYTLYDSYGRPEEVGVVESCYDFFTEEELYSDDFGADFKNWVYNKPRTEVTITNYDSYSNTLIPAKFKIAPKDENLRLRVAQIRSYSSIANVTVDLETTYESAIYYSYDEHGNVIEQIQDVPMMAVVEQDVKSTIYSFELLSGNVNKVEYQRGELDQFTHEYLYDNLNRLTEVYTSSDGVHKVRDAHYYYYDYGPLARTELGDHKVQGQDFVYTINGWLKGMNSSELDPNMDMGNDGLGTYAGINSNINSLFARDVNAYTIGYFENDYASISGSNFEHTIQGPFNLEGQSLYNGNIRHLVTSIEGMTTLGTAYNYDQLNRLTEMTAFEYNGTSWATTNPTSDYYNSYTYDKNGNIMQLQRNGTSSSNSLLMDNFAYSYYSINGEASNRLNWVNDSGADDISSQEGDIKSGQTNLNYQYDKIGQLVKDNQENINAIVWRKGDKKMYSITKTNNDPDLVFYYNPLGLRIAKLTKHKYNPTTYKPEDEWDWTYYSYDANGQVMAVYDLTMSGTENSARLAEQHIYGNNRIGMLSTSSTIYDNSSPNINNSDISELEAGLKRFELTNHLDNVQAVISDRKLWNSAELSFDAVLILTSDYYPFGQVMPGRNSLNGDYRYAYNGMEQDPEVSGNGNSYTTEFRQYDPRLARWKSLDPLMHQFPWMSPYCAFDNNPVYYIDPYGLSSVNGDEGKGEPEKKIIGNGQEINGEFNGDKQLDEVKITAKSYSDSEVSSNKMKAIKGEGKFADSKYDNFRSRREAYELSKSMMGTSGNGYGTTQHFSNYQRYGWAAFDYKNVPFNEIKPQRPVPFEGVEPMDAEFISEVAGIAVDIGFVVIEMGMFSPGRSGFSSGARRSIRSSVRKQALKEAAKSSTKILGKTVQKTTTRIGRDGKAVEIIFKDGSKIDINRARVKQWVPNTHPKAPPGTLQKVKFPNSLPGSKGYKRLPTQKELDILKVL